MILPTRKTILLLLAPVVVLVVWPTAAGVAFALVYNAAVLALAGLDVRASVRPSQLRITRHLPRRLSLDAENEVTWEVRNLGTSKVRLRITDDLPETFACDELPMEATLGGRQGVTLQYHVRPALRGQFELGDTHIRWRTTLGLAVHQRRLPTRETVKVYPNVQNVRKHELLAQRHGMSAAGAMAMRQRGKGSIFESLRDYVPGDELADIAWKATARRGRLMTRNYETDRSQNILLVLDCGRMMATQVDRLSRLDHAINAAIMLTHVAVKQGDYIGMVAFSDEVGAYLPPTKGQRAMSLMNEALYPLQPRLRESDYAGVCRFLALQHRKRSMIVIFTDVVDKEASSPLLSYMARFARQHVPLCVTLRDLDVEAAAAGEPVGARQCYEQAVAVELLDRRSRALAWMRQTGVDVLDVDPHALTPKLIEQYLLLKQRRRL